MQSAILQLAFVLSVTAGSYQKVSILDSASCCSSLKTCLGQKVAFPNQSLYNASTSSYWSKQEQELLPSCIVKPESTGDVAATVHVLTRRTLEYPTGCKFAVKGGGHAMWAGAANIADGVTVDLGAMNDVVVNEVRTLTSVSAGARWLDVYEKLEPLGLMVTGGRDSNVGVAGLALGGGLSYFAPGHGFVCDNVVNYEIVLASGKIVNANSTSHPDLFFALKGGSNNFGVVTRFDLKTFPRGNIWGGPIGFEISSKNEQFEAFSRFIDSDPYDEYAAVIHAYAFLPGQQQWVISNMFTYTKAEAYPEALRELTNIQPQIYNGVRVTELAIEMDGSNPNGKRQLYATATFANDAALLSRIFDVANDTLQSIQQIPGLMYALAYQPLPTSITSISQRHGDNAMGLHPRDGNLVLVFIDISWSEPMDDELVNAQGKRFLEEVEFFAQGQGKLHRWKYLNYAAQWQDPITGYGHANQEKLRAASRKYDPAQVFQKQVPGGFKLF